MRLSFALGTSSRNLFHRYGVQIGGKSRYWWVVTDGKSARSSSRMVVPDRARPVT